MDHGAKFEPCCMGFGKKDSSRGLDKRFLFLPSQLLCLHMQHYKFLHRFFLFITLVNSLGNLKIFSLGFVGNGLKRITQLFPLNMSSSSLLENYIIKQWIQIDRNSKAKQLTKKILNKKLRVWESMWLWVKAHWHCL